MPDEFKDRLLFSREESARFLGVSIKTIDRLIAKGALMTARPPLTTRITRASLTTLVTPDAREAA